MESLLIVIILVVLLVIHLLKKLSIMHTKEINTKTSVNWIQVNSDGTNTYFGALAAKWIYNENLQNILREYHKMTSHSTNCHLHIWECSDLNNSFLLATQKSDMRADSFITDTTVLIILERIARNNCPVS